VSFIASEARHFSRQFGAREKILSKTLAKELVILPEIEAQLMQSTGSKLRFHSGVTDSRLNA